MLTVIWSLISAAAFGLNNVVARRGVLRANAYYIATISILAGPPFFLVVTLFTGDLFGIGRLSFQAYVFWALSGVVHFALGRTWAYRSIHLIGATRSSVITGLYPVATIILAMIFLEEIVTPLMAVGIFASLGGPLVIALREQTVSSGAQGVIQLGGKDIDRKTLYLGMAFGAGTAVCWGSSSIFIKFALEHGGTPMLGSLIAYLAACVAIGPSTFLGKENRRSILRRDRKSLYLGLLVALGTNVSQLARYLAISYGSVIIFSLVSRTVSIWILIFAFIFARRYESFSGWVFLGNTLLIIGLILVLIA